MLEAKKSAKQSTDEDKAAKNTRKDLFPARRQRSSASDQKNVASQHGRPRDVLTPADSSGINDQPGYAHLYDERLIKSNTRCYIQ